MNLQYVEEFIKLSEVHSYTEVAADLNISDSTLSRHIMALEEYLGINLFDRTSRSVRLNAFGQVFLPYAKQLVQLRERSLREIEYAKERSRSTLTVAVHYYIDDLLTRFHLYDNSVSVSRVGNVRSTAELLDLLRLGTCEVAFVIDPVDSDGEFEVLPYDTDHYAALLPEKHPLAKRKNLHLSELSTDDFISFKAGTHGDLRLRQFCREAGFEPRIVFDGEVGSKVAEFVNHGIGISIVLKKSIQKTMPSGVCLVDIEPLKPVEVFMCWRKSTQRSYAAKRFTEYVADIWLKAGQSSETESK